MFLRKGKAATLGLIPCLLLIIALIGISLYYMTQFFGGNKQLANGTDSGTLAAARQLLTVGLSSTEITNLPTEFQALGVDKTGKPTGLTSSGTPNLTNAIFNVYAFNRAAGLTLLVALNAAEDGSPAAVANANTLITALNTFGTQLNADLQSCPQLATSFSTLASSNNVNMLGSNSSIELGNNGDLTFASVPGEGGGLANVYFNSAVYANDTTMAGWIQQMTSSAGVTSQINNRYNQNDPSAQSGQSFVLGYKTIDISAITGVAGFTPQIFACAVNPSQMPHMIDSGRFNTNNTPGTCYAPCNSLAAQGQATCTSNGANLLCAALACAMLGSYDNQYPINMPYGWIRIQNGKDAIAANPSLSPVPLYAGNGDTIYNRQLWSGPGGEYGIWSANNGVFCTESFDDPNNPFNPGPIYGYSGGQEIQAWQIANTTPCTGSCIPDVNGLNPALDPNLLQPNGTYILGYQSPTINMRYSANYEQTATLANMLGITSVNPICTSSMYQDAGSTPTYCASGASTWAGNYILANYWVPPDDYGTQPTGGLTNIEYVKGAVIGGLDSLWDAIAANGGGGESNPLFNGYTYTLTVGKNPSGSKYYDHSGLTGYATPGTAPGTSPGIGNTSITTAGVAFGTVATPLKLIQQLSDNQPSGAPTNCADTSASSSQWADVSSPLGKLLQRCQMIVSSTTATDVVNLLNTYNIDLNEYQYIYLPAGGTKLVISNSPPGFLAQYPEFSAPGSTQPDGTSIYSCQDAAWGAGGNGQTNLPLNRTIINTGMNYSGNASGDDTTNGEPFETYAGNLATWDAMNWTSNSGRYFFLGQLSFGNYVNGNGTASTFSSNGGTFGGPN